MANGPRKVNFENRLRWDGIEQRWVKPQPPAPPQAAPFDWNAELEAHRQAAMGQQQAVREPAPPAPMAVDLEWLLGDAPQVVQEAQPVVDLGPPPGWGNELRPMRLRDKPQMLNIKEGPSGFRTLSERSTRLPRFKLKYATLDEMRLRLEGTYVTVQDRMVKIQKVQMVKQDGEVGEGCIAMDENGDLQYLILNDEGLNLRSPDPGYIQLGQEAFFFRRRPARVYKQGVSGENTHFTKAGRDNGRTGVFGYFPEPTILKAFNERPVIPFSEEAMKDMVSMRLSDRIAIFKRNGGKLHVEHRGVELGRILNGNKVKVENSSIWVENALMAVGLEVME